VSQHAAKKLIDDKRTNDSYGICYAGDDSKFE
jgi:hypothetical protein